MFEICLTSVTTLLCSLSPLMRFAQTQKVEHFLCHYPCNWEGGGLLMRTNTRPNQGLFDTECCRRFAIVIPWFTHPATRFAWGVRLLSLPALALRSFRAVATSLRGSRGHLDPVMTSPSSGVEGMVI